MTGKVVSKLDWQEGCVCMWEQRGHTRSDDGERSIEAFLFGFIHDRHILVPDLLGGAQNHKQEAGVSLLHSVRVPFPGRLLISVT